MGLIRKMHNDRHSVIGRWIIFFGVIIFGALAAIWWKMSLAPKGHLVLYFRQSIHGLNIGSPVKVMGVEVGQVESLGIYIPEQNAGDDDETDPHDSYYAVVQIAIEDKRLRARGLPKELDSENVLETQIARGMRGQFALASPMTGECYIEITFRPDSPDRRVTRGRKDIPEVPTLDRGMAQFLESAPGKIINFSKINFLEKEREWNATLDEFLTKTNPENFAAASADITSRLERANAILGDPALREECREINQKTKELRHLLEDQSHPLLKKIADGRHLFHALQRSFAVVNKSAGELESLLAFDSPALRDARHQLQKLRNVITGLSTNLHLPSRHAIPNAPRNTGLSPSGQSEMP